jgi:5-methylcytosine-specific restriction endonuclease McrA
MLKRCDECATEYEPKAAQQRFCCQKCKDRFNHKHEDHIIPLSAFQYNSPMDPAFRTAWSLNNLRPLEASENIKKGNKIVAIA